VELESATKSGEPLHIVVFASTDGELESQFIVGDGVRISVPVMGGSLSAVLKLLVAYYVFDVDYPKPYAMILGILQQLCLEERYTGKFSQKARLFMKKLKKNFDEVGDEVPNTILN